MIWEIRCTVTLSEAKGLVRDIAGFFASLRMTIYKQNERTLFYQCHLYRNENYRRVGATAGVVTSR